MFDGIVGVGVVIGVGLARTQCGRVVVVRLLAFVNCLTVVVCVGRRVVVVVVVAMKVALVVGSFVVVVECSPLGAGTLMLFKSVYGSNGGNMSREIVWL